MAAHAVTTLFASLGLSSLTLLRTLLAIAFVLVFSFHSSQMTSGSSAIEKLLLVFRVVQVYRPRHAAGIRSDQRGRGSLVFLFDVHAS
jgi:hypothetical protein